MDIKRHFRLGAESEAISPWRFSAYLLVTFLAVVQTNYLQAKGPKDHEDPSQGGSGREINGPDGVRTDPDSAGPPSSGCGVNPQEIADFAKGTAFRYPAMVTFLSSPDCIENGRGIAQAALLVGNIKFNDQGPLRLDRFASQVQPDELETAGRIDSLVARTFPALLRDNPLPSRELLSLTGQLAVLSPSAARDAWVTLVQQELSAGDDMLNNANSTAGRSAVAATLAQSLDKLGLEQPVIARAMGGRIQDMALMVQVDSLSRVFRALGAATGADPNLAAVFNLSAGSLSRGVKRGDKLFSNLDRKDLLKTVFIAVKASLGINEELDEAGTELNEAVAILAKGDSNDLKKLKLAWSLAVEMLSKTNTQSVLAKAVALSLTPDVIYISSTQGGKQLVGAARNYASIAFALQGNYLRGLIAVDDNVQSGELSGTAWTQLKKNFLEPMAAELVSLGPDRIDPLWLREVCQRNLLRDEDIEKRFPHLVLAYLNQREDKMKQAMHEPDAEAGVGMMAQNLVVLWTLSNVHYPALADWAKRYEQKKN